MPLEAAYHRVVLNASERHSDEGDRQWLLHDDEVILGNAECVHIGWVQEPSTCHASHDCRLIEHGEFLRLTGIIYEYLDLIL